MYLTKSHGLLEKLKVITVLLRFLEIVLTDNNLLFLIIKKNLKIYTVIIIILNIKNLEFNSEKQNLEFFAILKFHV